MKKLQVCLFAVLTLPHFLLASPSPCVSGSLQSYINLNGSGGCTVGATSQYTLSNFAFLLVNLAVGSNGPVSPADVGINGTTDVNGNPELVITALNGHSFDTQGVLGLAGAYTSLVGFSVDSTVPTTGFIKTDLDIQGITSGIVSANQVLEANCLGGLLPRPLSAGGLACLGGGITATTTASTPQLNADATASLVYASVTHVDVIKEIAQAVALGDASITSITQTFETASSASETPEPATFLLLGSSLVVLGGVRIRRKKA